MQKIKTKINSMRSEDLAIVGIRVVETIEKSVAEEVKNSLLFTQLIEVTNQYRKAIEPDNRAEKAAIKEKFQFRTELFGNFYDMAYGMTGSRNADDKAAAVRVFSVLNTYGTKRFYGIRQSALTQRYAKFVETLQQPGFAADIERLRMADILTELADTHATYEAMYQDLGNQKSQRIPSREMRLEMNNALKVMADEVEYFSKKFPTDVNITLCKNVEQRIAEVYVTAPGAAKKESSIPTVLTTENSSSVS